MYITDDYSFNTLSIFLDIVDRNTADEIESIIVNSESV